MYFGNRRPRSFHYNFRFSNERRELLDSLRRGVPPEQLAEQSLNGDSANTSSTGWRRQRLALPGCLAVMALAVLAMLLLAFLFCLA